ncbi:MAG: DUF1284 domain-containing protein [Thermodesulfovibrionales bacterium]
MFDKLNLRGHHLICLHFFEGEGYDSNFIENLKNIMQRTENENINVCDGADDVCEKCPYLKDYRCQYDNNADDEIRDMDEVALRLLKIEQGAKIRWEDVRKKIPEIFLQWFRAYCYDCDWLKACEKNEFYQKLKRRALR